MLDAPDIFGCAAAAAAPLISQAPLNQPPLGYSQAYMQEIFAIKERCKGLETQLMKVTTERDTLKMMLDQLSTSLQKPTTVASVTKTAQMYLNLHFWTQSQYNEWTNTPEAHGNTRYKFAFIEDEQGTMVPDRTLKAIRKTVRGCWAELVDKGMAPKTWGKANTSAKEVNEPLGWQQNTMTAHNDSYVTENNDS
ncbi:hypothetical protein OG21DRAFT_1526623 [Imleria badia]|nr:hypothetical protein OG21DRAFT_1526623 [Imleria badia]